MEMAARTGARADAARKRKVNDDAQTAVELRPAYSQLKKQRRDDVVFSPNISAESVGSENDDVCEPDDRAEESSCCSSNGSSELVEERSVKFVDLEEESDQVESGTYNSGRERREMTTMTRTSEVQVADTDEAQSNKKAESQSPVVNTTHLSAALREFFSAVEKENHKRFSEKYNYDIVKDEPVEGRWEWTRLKP